MIRINKYLADAGIASRRSAEQYIKEGRVRVNGEVMRDLSYKVSDTDTVTMDGKNVGRAEETVYIMLNKPKGIVTTCDDQFGRSTVLDVIGDVGARVYPVGRLDYATEGLLLLTNDGEFSRVVMHPSSMIEKTYAAELHRPVTREELAIICAGVVIDEEKTAPAKAALTDKNFKANPNLRESRYVIISITEGRNRQVRKMFFTQNARVRALRRIAIGGLTLGNLKVGGHRFLDKKELFSKLKM
jgi:23S rRNA pseudouridine2605 synthase